MYYKKKHQSVSSPIKQDYWVSYSDLLAGLLLVFVLLLVVSMYNYAAFIEQREEQVVKRDQILREQELRLMAFEEKKRELIQALSQSLTDLDVQVDSLSGVVRIGEGVLFEEDRAELLPDGLAKMELIFNQYVRVVLSPEYQSAVDRIIIEGHTNSRGVYLHNLNLSQQRANAVMRAWLEMPGIDHQTLEGKIVASGRSWADLIMKEDGTEDRVKSRRIEIAFRLKESELMQSVYEKVRGTTP